jgi:hypothetical protein
MARLSVNYAHLEQAPAALFDTGRRGRCATHGRVAALSNLGAGHRTRQHCARAARRRPRGDRLRHHSLHFSFGF